MDYRVLVDIECLDSLPKSRSRREAILQFCSTLAMNHHKGGDHQMQDADNLRVYELSVFENHAITWWTDSPAKCVVIIDIVNCR